MARSFDDALGLGEDGPTWNPPEPPSHRDLRSERRHQWLRRIRRRVGRLFGRH